MSNDVTKAVFLADAHRGSGVTKMVVKFAHKYSEEGHMLLVAALQAPKLHYCRFEASLAMWVVVMYYVQGEKVTGVLTKPVHIASPKAAVTKLQKHGRVFCDLRRPNLLIVKDRVVLIDFDWCGPDGEARYPSDILLTDYTKWHSDVKRGACISKAHDAYLFECLTEKKLSVN